MQNSGGKILQSSGLSCSSLPTNLNPTDKPFAEFVGKIFSVTTIGTVFGKAEKRYLNPYPYFNFGEYSKEKAELNKRNSFKLGTSYLVNIVKSFDIIANYKPIPILGVELAHFNFTEKNRALKERLNTTFLTANYYRFRVRHFTGWWGLRLAYVAEEVNSYGFAYTLGAETYPFNPISLHLSYKEALINRSSIGLFKLQLKYHLKRIALFVGFHDYYTSMA
ncbi:MAG: hypothetical protein ACK5H1_07715 [Tenacibaculum sp.]